MPTLSSKRRRSIIQIRIHIFVKALYTRRPGPLGSFSHKNSPQLSRIPATSPAVDVHTHYYGVVRVGTVVVFDFGGHHPEHEHTLLLWFNTEIVEINSINVIIT